MTSISRILFRLFLAFLLLWQGLVPSLVEANVWSDRAGARENVQLAGLPAAPSFALPPVAHTLSAVSAPRRSASSPALSALGARFGRVRAPAVARPNARLVIHFQDIHRNAEAQRNISDAIKAALGAGPVGLVAVEGGFGDIDLSRERGRVNDAARLAAADFLLSRNRIAGPLHAALTAADAPKVVGIDDRALYDRNVDAYRRASGLVAVQKERLTVWRNAVVDARPRLNADLRRLEDFEDAFDAGTAPFGRYVEELARLAPAGPQTSAFLKALALEREMDFPAVEAERARFIEALVHGLTPAGQQRLLVLSRAYRDGELEHAAFYSSLRAECAGAGVAIEKFPRVDRYIRYVEMSSAIDGDALTAETDRARASLEKSLARTPDERAQTANARWFRLAGKLLTFALSPAEWRELAALPPGARPSFPQSDQFWNALAPFEDFYRAAEARDAAMARRVVEAARGTRGPVILVTGGFHTSGIGAALSNEGFTVATFVPRLTTVDVDGASLYLTAFTDEKAPLERLGQGEKLFLAQPVWTPGIRLTTRVYGAVADLFFRWSAFTPAAAARRFTEVTGLTASRVSHSEHGLLVETEEGPVRVDARFDADGRMNDAEETVAVLPLGTRLLRSVTELPRTLWYAIPGTSRVSAASFLRNHPSIAAPLESALVRVAGMEVLVAATRFGAAAGFVAGAVTALAFGLPVIWVVLMPLAATVVTASAFNVGTHAAFNLSFPWAPLALGSSPGYRDATERATQLWADARAMQSQLGPEAAGTAGDELYAAIGLAGDTLAPYVVGTPRGLASMAVTRYALPENLPANSPLNQLISLAGTRDLDVLRDAAGRPVAIIPAPGEGREIPASAHWIALWDYNFDPPAGIDATAIARWMRHAAQSARTLTQVRAYIGVTGRGELGRLGSILDEDGSQSEWWARIDAVANPSWIRVSGTRAFDSPLPPMWLIEALQERARVSGTPSAMATIPVYPTVFSPAASDVPALDRAYHTEILRLAEAFSMLWGARGNDGPLEALVMGGGSGIDTWLLSRAFEFAVRNDDLPLTARLRIRVRDINPIAIANVRAMARLNGINVEAEVGGIPESGSHDLVIWNMPSYSPDRTTSSLGHAYQRAHDGDGGKVLEAFSNALPRLLRRNGLAVLWNVATFDSVDHASNDHRSNDIIEEALRSGGAYLHGKNRVSAMNVGTITDPDSIRNARRLVRVYFVRHLDALPEIQFGTERPLPESQTGLEATWSFWAAPWAAGLSRAEAVRRSPWLESIATLIPFFAVSYGLIAAALAAVGAYDHVTAALVAGLVANAAFALLHLPVKPVLPIEIRRFFQAEDPGSPLARTAAAFGLADAVVVDGPTEVAAGLREYTLAPRNPEDMALLRSELGKNVTRVKLLVGDDRPIAIFPDLPAGVRAALARLNALDEGAAPTGPDERMTLTTSVTSEELRYLDVSGLFAVPKGLYDRSFWAPYFERRDAYRVALDEYRLDLGFPPSDYSMIRSADAGKQTFAAVDIDFGRGFVVPENFSARRWTGIINRYEANKEPDHVRVLLTLLPLVYSPAFEGVAEEDEQYYRTVMNAPDNYERETGRTWKGGERVLLIGAGSGLDTLMMLLASLRKTGHTLAELQSYIRENGRAPGWAPVIEARDVNPLAVENTRLLFESLGISPVVTVVEGTLPESPTGAPYDVVLWNMPLHPGTSNPAFLVETRTMIQFHDGGTNGVSALKNLVERLPRLLAENGIGIFWNHAVIDRRERDIFKRDMSANDDFSRRKMSVSGGNETGGATVYVVSARADRGGDGPTPAPARIDARGQLNPAARIAWLFFVGAVFHGPFFLAAAYAPALLPVAFAWAVASHRAYNLFVAAARQGRLGPLLSRVAAVLPFAAIKGNDPSREALNLEALRLLLTLGFREGNWQPLRPAERDLLNRYYAPRRIMEDTPAELRVGQGEFVVARNQLILTSHAPVCCLVAIRDPATGIGLLAHVDAENADALSSYEALRNALIAAGVSPESVAGLEIRLFGNAASRNGRVARLIRGGFERVWGRTIPPENQDFGGDDDRSVAFHTGTGEWSDLVNVNPAWERPANRSNPVLPGSADRTVDPVGSARTIAQIFETSAHTTTRIGSLAGAVRSRRVYNDVGRRDREAPDGSWLRPDPLSGIGAEVHRRLPADISSAISVDEIDGLVRRQAGLAAPGAADVNALLYARADRRLSRAQWQQVFSTMYRTLTLHFYDDAQILARLGRVADLSGDREAFSASLGALRAGHPADLSDDLAYSLDTLWIQSERRSVAPPVIDSESLGVAAQETLSTLPSDLRSTLAGLAPDRVLAATRYALAALVAGDRPDLQDELAMARFNDSTRLNGWTDLAGRYLDFYLQARLSQTERQIILDALFFTADRHGWPLTSARSFSVAGRSVLFGDNAGGNAWNRFEDRVRDMPAGNQLAELARWLELNGAPAAGVTGGSALSRLVALAAVEPEWAEGIGWFVSRFTDIRDWTRWTLPESMAATVRMAGDFVFVQRFSGTVSIYRTDGRIEAADAQRQGQLLIATTSAGVSIVRISDGATLARDLPPDNIWTGDGEVRFVTNPSNRDLWTVIRTSDGRVLGEGALNDRFSESGGVVAVYRRGTTAFQRLSDGSGILPAGAVGSFDVRGPLLAVRTSGPSRATSETYFRISDGEKILGPVYQSGSVVRGDIARITSEWDDFETEVRYLQVSTGRVLWRGVGLPRAPVEAAAPGPQEGTSVSWEGDYLVASIRRGARDRLAIIRCSDGKVINDFAVPDVFTRFGSFMTIGRRVISLATGHAVPGIPAEQRIVNSGDVLGVQAPGSTGWTLIRGRDGEVIATDVQARGFSESGGVIRLDHVDGMNRSRFISEEDGRVLLEGNFGERFTAHRDTGLLDADNLDTRRREVRRLSDQAVLWSGVGAQQVVSVGDLLAVGELPGRMEIIRIHDGARIIDGNVSRYHDYVDPDEIANDGIVEVERSEGKIRDWTAIDVNTGVVIARVDASGGRVVVARLPTSSELGKSPTPLATWSLWSAPWAFNMARAEAIRRAPWTESAATLLGFFPIFYTLTAALLAVVGAYDHTTVALIAGLAANALFAALHEANRGRLFALGALFHAPFVAGIAALPVLLAVSPLIAIAVPAAAFAWSVVSHRTHNDDALAEAAADNILRSALDLPPVQSMGLEDGGRPVTMAQLSAPERAAAFSALDARARRLPAAGRPAINVVQKRLLGLFSSSVPGSVFAQAGEKDFVVPVSEANKAVVDALVVEASSRQMKNAIRLVLPSSDPAWTAWLQALRAKSGVRLEASVAAVTREEGNRTVVELPALEAEIQRLAPTAADRKNMAVLLAGDVLFEGGTRAEFSDLMRDVEVRMVISLVEGAWRLGSVGSLEDMERAARLVSVAA